MSERMLISGEPVPEDRSHTEINPATGMQRDYVVLSADERAKGFVKRVRYSYVHRKCGVVTRMGAALAETYARDPNFYNGTFCVSCKAHFPLEQFEWDDGEPMHTALQPAWAEQKAQEREQYRLKRIADLEQQLAELKRAP